MGKSYKKPMFFADNIKVDPHTASKVEYLKPISIAEFAGGDPVSLEVCLENGELHVYKGAPGTSSYEFIEGPEYLDPDDDYLGEKKAALAD